MQGILVIGMVNMRYGGHSQAQWTERLNGKGGLSENKRLLVAGLPRRLFSNADLLLAFVPYS